MSLRNCNGRSFPAARPSGRAKAPAVAGGSCITCGDFREPSGRGQPCSSPSHKLTNSTGNGRSQELSEPFFLGFRTLHSEFPIQVNRPKPAETDFTGFFERRKPTETVKLANRRGNRVTFSWGEGRDEGGQFRSFWFDQP